MAGRGGTAIGISGYQVISGQDTRVSGYQEASGGRLRGDGRATSAKSGYQDIGWQRHELRVTRNEPREDPGINWQDAGGPRLGIPGYQDISSQHIRASDYRVQRRQRHTSAILAERTAG